MNPNTLFTYLNVVVSCRTKKAEKTAFKISDTWETKFCCHSKRYTTSFITLFNKKQFLELIYEQRERLFHLAKWLYRFNGRLKSLMNKKIASVSFSFGNCPHCFEFCCKSDCQGKTNKLALYLIGIKLNCCFCDLFCSYAWILMSKKKTAENQAWFGCLSFS